MKKEVFEFKFDIEQSKKLSKAVNEKQNLSIEKISKIKLKNKNNKVGNQDYYAWDRICAIMDRLDDTINYLNMIKLGENSSNYRSAFDFYDFINNAYIVLNCIKTISQIFGVKDEKIKNIENSTEIFQQPGLDGRGSDADFFEYVRSLSAVHPIDTSRHPAYHGYNQFHCSPFVVYSKKLWGINDDSDLTVKIYTSDKDGGWGKSLKLYVKNFEDYIKKWINFIDEIIITINQENINTYKYFRTRKIKAENEFDSYVDYLENLKTEISERWGSHEEVIDYYIKVFSLNNISDRNLKQVNCYKNAIKYSIEFLHKRLQDMNDKNYKNDENTGIYYSDYNVETFLALELDYPHSHNSQIQNKYGYEISKVLYLDYDSGYYNKDFAYKMIKNMKEEFLDKYVFIEDANEEFEFFFLINVALYLDCLENKCLLNKNIPNDRKYRIKLLSEYEFAQIRKAEPIPNYSKELSKIRSSMINIDLPKIK